MPNFCRRLWFRWKLGEFWIVLVHLSSTPPAWMQYMLDCDMDKSTAEIGSYHLQGKRNLPGVNGAIFESSCIQSLLSDVWIYEYGIDMDVEINMDMDMKWYRVAFGHTLCICGEWYCLDNHCAFFFFLQEFASCSVWALWRLFGKRSGHSNEQDGCSPWPKTHTRLKTSKMLRKMCHSCICKKASTSCILYLCFCLSAFHFCSSKLLRCRWLPTMLGAPDCPCQLRFLSRQLGDHDVQGAQHGMQLLIFLWQV